MPENPLEKHLTELAIEAAIRHGYTETSYYQPVLQPGAVVDGLHKKGFRARISIRVEILGAVVSIPSFPYRPCAATSSDEDVFSGDESVAFCSCLFRHEGPHSWDPLFAEWSVWRTLSE